VVTLKNLILFERGYKMNERMDMDNEVDKAKRRESKKRNLEGTLEGTYVEKKLAEQLQKAEEKAKQIKKKLREEQRKKDVKNLAEVGKIFQKYYGISKPDEVEKICKASKEILDFLKTCEVENVEQLKRAVKKNNEPNKVEPDERVEEVLILRARGMNYDEIATRLGISRSSVGRDISKNKERLKILENEYKTEKLGGQK